LEQIWEHMRYEFRDEGVIALEAPGRASNPDAAPTPQRANHHAQRCVQTDVRHFPAVPKAQAEIIEKVRVCFGQSLQKSRSFERNGIASFRGSSWVRVKLLPTRVIVAAT
jgi:hypothetical protein